MFKAITKFLRTVIIKTDNVYIDLWSVVHFTTGYILYSYFKFEPLVAIALIGLYEVIEPKIPTFRREHRADTIWDLIITITGYVIARGGI